MLACLCSLFLMGTPMSMEDDDLHLRLGDRIVFLGDSITQAGVGPKGYVTLIKQHLAESTRT